MESQNNMKLNKIYLGSVILSMLILPVISILIDPGYRQGAAIMPSMGKWFVFWAIGIRLLAAGIRQVAKPAFTAQEIFHIHNVDSQIIVRELGFANVCFGLTGVLSIFIPVWCSAAAFAGGLYMGIAGVYHFIKKPASPNEVIAMVSDIFIFIVLAVYVYSYFM